MWQFDLCIWTRTQMARRTDPQTPHSQRVFLHSPAMSRRGRGTPKRVKPPYRGAPRHECSVYFFWWEFLRCHEGYKAFCLRGGSGRGAKQYGRLYEDFGNVHAWDFVTWWNARGVELFAEPEELVVRRLDPGERVTSDPDIAVVSIPLSLSLRKINNRIKHLLATEIDRVKGQQRSRARYPVASRPVLSSLYKTLRVHRARREHPHIHLYEIAEQLGIENRSLSSDTAAHRRWQTSEIARHLRLARCLIENVVLGVFPMSKPMRPVAADTSGK